LPIDRPPAHNAAEDSGDDDEVDGAILYVIHELSRVIATTFDRYMAPYRLTHSQWWALMHIGRNPGASQTDLAQMMQMTRGAAGKLLDRLEAQNWIERREDPADSRVRRVFLADRKGMPIPTETEAIRLYRAILGSVSPKDRLKLLGYLQQMHSNAQAELDASQPGGSDT
jgi:MarR family transcriptional regulator for hemolysin